MLSKFFVLCHEILRLVSHSSFLFTAPRYLRRIRFSWLLAPVFALTRLLSASCKSPRSSFSRRSTLLVQPRPAPRPRPPLQLSRIRPAQVLGARRNVSAHATDTRRDPSRAHARHAVPTPTPSQAPLRPRLVSSPPAILSEPLPVPIPALPRIRERALATNIASSHVLDPHERPMTPAKSRRTKEGGGHDTEEERVQDTDEQLGGCSSDYSEFFLCGILVLCVCPC